MEINKKYFINYADKGFKTSQREALRRAESFGFLSFGLTYSDLDEQFLSQNSLVLSSSRGAGYWLWKPHIIHTYLNKIDDGDYLVYMDSGAFFTKDPQKYLEMIDPKIGHYGFSMIQKTSKWTKGDCFYEINKNRDYRFSNENQLQATYLFFKNCQFIRDFVSKWLELSQKVNLITDSPNLHLPNMSDFIDHRHDQAIYSLLCYNMGIPIVPQIDQWRKEHDLHDDDYFVNRHGIRQ
jgi:hypothetical protein